ncbi:molybdate ABC transporter substrate-binding protein [Desulfovibrio inopinatus]|uniref:molybdate ABC transporter substrate-binding protein n=1 Tax=Desulfovibrio inopinatus TaxID=102109 RepID=UPI000414C1D2|nr:molybdate ABC transporter substrate-binding protein [Desulfovibrio inopinatus]
MKLTSRLLRILIVTVALVCLAAPAFAAALTVSAAASLTDAFTDLKPAFEKANPDVTVTFNFASSGALYRQIEQGAPVDVFASANQQWMKKAVEGGLVTKDSVKNFASNTLVLAVPKGNPAKISGPDSLKEASVTRIGIGQPKTVPAGRYAEGSLKSLGMYDELMSKYIFGESVRQVLDYLIRGEIQAGFVYATDAKKGGDGLEIVATMPLEKPITYPIGILKDAASPDLAKTFIEFVLSPDGQKLLEARGFSAVKK